jgi:hypothetical protein
MSWQKATLDVFIVLHIQIFTYLDKQTKRQKVMSWQKATLDAFKIEIRKLCEEEKCFCFQNFNAIPTSRP